MTSKTIRDIALKTIERTTVKLPPRGYIHAIDGNTADVRVPGSGSVLRNIPVIGDVTLLSRGQLVVLSWSQDPGVTGPHPMILVQNRYVYGGI
jgi:hypothetical protein